MDKLVKRKGMFPYGAKWNQEQESKQFTNPGILKGLLTKVLLWWLPQGTGDKTQSLPKLESLPQKASYNLYKSKSGINPFAQKGMRKP